MAVHFHPLKIKNIKRETGDCISISFEVPDHLQQDFLFKEGQNITIRKSVQGEDVRRSYSICSAPHENELKVAIKRVPGGLFSSFANDQLKEGDILDIMPPVGKFNIKSAAGNFLAIAAGSGITPVISIIKHVLKTNKQSNFTLVYGNKSRGSIIFFDELEGLKNKYIDRFAYINILSQERMDAAINYGRIDDVKLEALSQIIPFEKFDDIFLCGPETLIFESEKFLFNRGIESDKIHFELFTSPGQKRNSYQMPVLIKEDSPKSRIHIKADGLRFDFELDYNSDSILDAALKKGADLPFACKGGVCCTCRAKLVKGNVKMDVNYALEQEEVASGFILTCQSHPITDEVEIDFDVK